MIRCLFLLFYVAVIDTKHFNGGTITWMPTDPYDNSTSVTISIIQTYWWTYPAMKCATNVPASTAGWSSVNATTLICVTDCSSDGNYSSKPVSVLTDCTSVSSALSIMTSQRSVNTTLASGAHLYVAYVGSAWRSLNYPAQNGLEWSIVTFIDIRMRPDGLINTPPVASVISPQYVIVNRATEIPISVSDVNAGDDVRCRWSKYTTGYRRRKRFKEEEHMKHEHVDRAHKREVKNGEIILVREKRQICNAPYCKTGCDMNCPCNCTICFGTTCTGDTCGPYSCPNTTTSTSTTTTTTPETPGTVKSTSSFPQRQAINECGGICYPGSVPSGTTLSNCTLSFTGLTSGTWYAIAIQVEDFISTTDTTPMSSVPVQFLIYVMPEPICSDTPIIIPPTTCLEVLAGVSTSVNLYVLNSCNVSVSNITAVIVSQGITGMQVGNVTLSPTDSSLSYVTLMWTPQASQIGLQKLCMIAYTSEQVQSEEYCVIFNVTTSAQICITTTTTSTTSSVSTSTSSTSTTTTATTTTSTVTTTTSITTQTTATVTTTTAITTKTTSTTATSTSSVSTSTAIPVIVAAATTATTTPEKGTNWGLVAGVSVLALLLTLCSCCLYYLLWSPDAKRRRQPTEEENRWAYGHLNSSTGSMVQSTAVNANENNLIEVPRKNCHVYNMLSQKNSVNSVLPTPDCEGSILVSIYNNTNARRVNSRATHPTEQSMEMQNAWIRPSTNKSIDNEISITRRATPTYSLANKTFNTEASNESFHINRQVDDQRNTTAFSSPSFNNGHFGISQSLPRSTSDIGHERSLGRQLHSLRDWTRLYLFGREHDTGVPRIPRPL